MKKLQIKISLIIMIVLVFIFCYLMGAFINTSFNISKWDEISRVLVCLSTAILSLFIGAMIIIKDIE